MVYDTSLPTPALRLLGTFRLEGADGSAVTVQTPGRRLLAFLALNGPTARDVLAGTLWPEVSEEHACGSLRTTLWRLHRASRPLLDCRRQLLALHDELNVDTHVFARTARRVVDTDGPPGDHPDVGLLFAGELLPGWDEEWVVFERERLRQLRLHALESLSRRLARHGQYALALDAALTGVGIEPLRESAHRAVVAVHLAENNLVEAVRHYHAYRRLARIELGLEPSPIFTTMLPPGRLPLEAAGQGLPT
ncbi:SARP family transcriptional regulator [Streptomyces sp. NBC_01478]|uniref:AfsR/SARP family transcriptional regulator n=1 Tax=Streptomyces sp. NBC_01478 TaxID=2903882 RepID=UPI002E34003C|nr:BTAD domain-containing putative transcriptional regulator [Streptomyces sp. NBC_01478]